MARLSALLLATALSYPLGLIVNVHGARFVDEGADFRNYTYARYGREILQQPQRLAFQLFDQKVVGILREEYRIREVTRAEAGTIEELARRLEIDPTGLARTVQEFNAAVQPGQFNPAILDGKGTRGIEPPKSNWALPLDTPPYVGYAVTCGITFTFGGVKVDTGARVLDRTNRPIPDLYAVGEAVGGLYYFNYASGTTKRWLDPQFAEQHRYTTAGPAAGASGVRITLDCREPDR